MNTIDANLTAGSALNPATGSVDPTATECARPKIILLYTWLGRLANVLYNNDHIFEHRLYPVACGAAALADSERDFINNLGEDYTWGGDQPPRMPVIDFPRRRDRRAIRPDWLRTAIDAITTTLPRIDDPEFPHPRFQAMRALLEYMVAELTAETANEVAP